MGARHRGRAALISADIAKMQTSMELDLHLTTLSLHMTTTPPCRSGRGSYGAGYG